MAHNSEPNLPKGNVELDKALDGLLERVSGVAEAAVAGSVEPALPKSPAKPDMGIPSSTSARPGYWEAAKRTPESTEKAAKLGFDLTGQDKYSAVPPQVDKE